MGRFNNRCCDLLARRRPSATVAQIQEFDRDLMETEAMVPADQRIEFALDTITDPQRILRYRSSGSDLWRGQQIFYVAVWHIRESCSCLSRFDLCGLSHKILSSNW